MLLLNQSFSAVSVNYSLNVCTYVALWYKTIYNYTNVRRSTREQLQVSTEIHTYIVRNGLIRYRDGRTRYMHGCYTVK